MPSTPDGEWQAFCAALFRRNEHTIKLGLDRVRDALAVCGHPEAGYRKAVVAGTNGKGTASAATAFLLRRAGLRVGLYTSPHLLDFTERFRVDGFPLGRSDVLHAGRMVLARCPELTFFEATTVIALELFARASVDVAILEVGLGGRLDAVNAVEPDAVAITSIALDHQDYLGDTLEAVAAEKAAVMRAGRPAVLAPQRPAADAVLRAWAARLGATLAAPVDGAAPAWMSGPFADNAAVARGLAHELGASDLNLAGFRWPARRDTALDGYVLDVAHNPAGAVSLTSYLGDDAPAVGILGLSADKDAEGIAAALASLPTRWVLTQARSRRAMAVSRLAQRVAALDVLAVSQCVQEAIEAASTDGAVLVTGSVYVIGDLLEAVNAGPEFFSLSMRSP